MSDFLKTLGIADMNAGGFGGEWIGSGPENEVITPIDGSVIGTVRQVTEDEYDAIVARAHEAFLGWRRVPAPRRGDIILQLGNRLREHKKELGALVTLEMGKIIAEGEGTLATDLGGFYRRATLEVKGRMVGSIFPGKLRFVNGECRTEGVNELFRLLAAKKGDLVKKDEGLTAVTDSQSFQAALSGIEPETS